MTQKRFNCHVKFSKMPNGFMVLDYTKKGKEQTVIEDISKEKAHSVMDRLNELSDDNDQLKQQNKKYMVMMNCNSDLNDEIYQQLKKTEKNYKSLLKENEQLQKEVKSKQRVINAYEQYINDLKEDGVIE